MNKTVIDVNVKPNSSKREIRIEDKIIKVWLHSPPADGRANKELVELFASTLRHPKSKIEITKGGSGRNKRVTINGMTKEELLVKLWPNQ